MDGLFKDIHQHTVVIIATHKPHAMKHVDRVVVMEAGQLAIDGPRDKVFEEIKRQSNARRAK